MANLLEAREWDYVVGSVHFLRDRPSTSTTSGTSGAAATRPSSLEALLRDARRGRAQPACSTSSPTPTWSRSGAGERPRPRATCAATTSPPSRRSPTPASRSRCRPPGCASRSARSTRRRPFLEMVVDAGCPIALSSRRARARPARLPLRATRRAAGRRRRDRARRVRAPRAAAGADRVSVRTGIGFDSHRFEPGRRLVLGGVEIPHERGLAGHSDADVLTHAIIDALLGAAGLGDIGEHFPDTDAALQGRRLDRAAARRRASGCAGAGCAIVHVDATVMIERAEARPAPRRDARDAGARASARPRSTSRRPPARAWASSAAARESPRWRSRRCSDG